MYLLYEICANWDPCPCIWIHHGLHILSNIVRQCKIYMLVCEIENDPNFILLQKVLTVVSFTINSLVYHSLTFEDLL